MPPPFTFQKYFGQLISHAGKQFRCPHSEIRAVLLTHSRLTVRKVLSPFILNRRILPQVIETGPLPSYKLTIADWSIWHSDLLPGFSFLPEKEHLLDNICQVFLMSPNVSFSSNKVFKEHQWIKHPNHFLKESAHDIKDFYIQSHQ